MVTVRARTTAIATGVTGSIRLVIRTRPNPAKTQGCLMAGHALRSKPPQKPTEC
jgi:hypothetical protein